MILYIEMKMILCYIVTIVLLLKVISHLKSCPVEGDVGHPLDRAIVEDIGYQEQSSYLFNCWGLKQVEV